MTDDRPGKIRIKIPRTAAEAGPWNEMAREFNSIIAAHKEVPKLLPEFVDNEWDVKAYIDNAFYPRLGYEEWNQMDIRQAAAHVKVFEAELKRGDRPKQQNSRQPRRRSLSDSRRELLKVVKELKAANFSHLEICRKLDAMAHRTPQNCNWSGLTWTKAFHHATYSGSVHKWLSNAKR